MPPSPWLSARMTKNRYLTEMMMTSAQNASEQIPNTFVAIDGELVPLPGEGLLDRVQRAGADVAIHDAERTQRQCSRSQLVPVGVTVAAHRRATLAIRPRPD